MWNWLTSPSISLSFITLISLLVNAVTIYRWISEKLAQSRVNDQAYQIVRGLALGNLKRSSMIVQRIRSLEKKGQTDSEAMIFLENMYADARSNTESLLATAKALKPEEAKKLPYDGESLNVQAMIEAELLRKQEPNIFIVPDQMNSGPINK